jgi:hypothetical protein
MLRVEIPLIEQRAEGRQVPIRSAGEDEPGGGGTLTP